MSSRWLIKPKPDQALVSQLQKDINVPHALAQILVQRDILDFNAAKEFFRPELEKLHDPYLMKDMDKAVERIKLAIQNQENIMVYGDYDVDGTTSVSLMYGFIKSIY